MSRYKSREQAFIFLFESTFGLQSAQEIIECAESIREDKLTDFARELFSGVIENCEEIDNYIEPHLKDWGKERLSRTTISILRIAVFEMLFCKETPVSVAINEAIELAKKYSTKQEASYINGVLGAVSKNIERQKQSS